MPSPISTVPQRHAGPPAPPSADGAQERLRLKPVGPVSGHVDGGWWPRSARLEDELPTLIAALRDRLGRVESVSYHLGDWDSPPRRVRVGDGIVRIAGYRLQCPGTIDVIAEDTRLTLLVVDAAESEPDARAMLDASSDPAVADDVATMLGHPALALPALGQRAVPADGEGEA